jgi:phage-related protein
VRSERQIIFHGQYFQDFFTAQVLKVREKIAYVLQLVRTVERVPEKFLKHVEGTVGLYEIRVEIGNDIYRVLCCFDRGNLVVLLNGFQKKSQKTPRSEIELALKLMDEYFAEKEKKNEKRTSDKKSKNIR